MKGIESKKIKNGFHFSNNTLLRQIKKDEIERFHKEPMFYLSDGAHLIPEINRETFVLEIIGDFHQTQLLAYEVLLAMRLHKTEPVFYKLFIVIEKSKVNSFGCINPPAPYKCSIYKLDSSEIEEVDELLSKINSMRLETNSSFRVACERFNRLFEERRIDDKIIDLAIAFEALFTGDISQPLSNMGIIAGLSCSMLLGKTTEDRETIKEFLKKLFEIRNGIVHKTKFIPRIIINNEECSINVFSAELQKYLRESIKKLL